MRTSRPPIIASSVSASSPKDQWLGKAQAIWDSVPTRPQESVELASCDPAGKGFLIAALARRVSSGNLGRLWIMTLHARRRDELASELAFWKCPTLVLAEPTVVVEEELADPNREAERQATLHRISRSPHLPVLLSRNSWQSAAPDLSVIDQNELTLDVGEELDPAELLSWLTEHDFEEHPQIFQRGQFAKRGGIIDFFPTQLPNPIRVEFFGDEIESIREFDVETQTTIKRTERVEISRKGTEAGPELSTWRSPEDLVLSIDEDDEGQVDILLTNKPEGSYHANLHSSPAAGFEAGDFVIADSSRAIFKEQLTEWQKAGWEVGLIAPGKAERHRFTEVLGPEADALTFVEGRLGRGFVFPEQKLAILSTLEIFGRQHLPGTRGTSRESHQRNAAAVAGVHELNEGELVVHADYGIGEFIGLVDGEEGREELSIEYQDGATLHVPIDQSHLVSRYVGVGGGKPSLNKLGDRKWKKSRLTAEAAVMDYAAHLLRLQAERDSKQGHAHQPDGIWMQDFEASFPFTETPDQRKAIEETKIDMESPRPMDRLICGDVGFGKTEVAIRAAFKAVTGGTQVAVLAPTTVLSEQHWRTFKARMSDYPFEIRLLSRLQSPAQARDTLEGLREGKVDIVIGTHRLLSSEIEYQKLGLLVVDEEQRFGVRHKEIMKERFRLIDVLTLSATPIPRTLYLSLMGARDMSTIDTPPPNRIPVETSICAYDERLIRNAIRRELTRGGQVFFLHNRVASIGSVKERIEHLVPEARVVIGHGQMDREDLESVMHHFVDGKADVLLATTIIESGIDIPNANTILIDRADRFGLADLYQLRGRVGRSGQRAYALLLLPGDLLAGGDARKRLSAIKQYTELGSGFKIAMRDLEIRGAGSLLGTKQSGHIAAVGFELYCQLLQQSVEQLQGKQSRRRADAQVRADFVVYSEGKWDNQPGQVPAFFPRSFGPDPEMRVAAHRQLASARSEKEISRIEKNWRDRFGRFPDPVLHLFEVHRLRVIASAKAVQVVEISKDRLMLQRNGDYILPPGGKFPRLSSRKAVDKLAESIALLRTL